MSNQVKHDLFISSQDTLTVRIEKRRSYRLSKRVTDLIGASAGLLLFFIPIIIIALLIKIENPSSRIFFCQKRVGKNGKVFNIYKLRSMVDNAEERLNDLLDYNEMNGAMFKMKDDPRVTRVGRFIRKTSMDEFPQFVNVLKGDMSLVGPRPPLPNEVSVYSDYEKQRLLVTPGCTGLWQVSGRSNLNFTQMVQLDLEYINNQSFWTDIKLILKTALLLIGSKDAY